MADVGEAQSLLNQVRAFDMNSLPRSEELGKAFNFSETVEPARKIQSLFNSIPVESISDLSSAALGI